MSASTALRQQAEQKETQWETRCWPWPGSVTAKGYGVTSDGRQAHVVAYERGVGPVPFGLEIDHNCHNLDSDCPGGIVCMHRRCVNPAHLEAVTHRENVLRGKGRTAVNAAKTHCIRGHEFSPENTLIRTNRGGVERTCLTCKRMRQRGRWQRLRGAAAPSTVGSAGSHPRAASAPSGERDR